MRIEMRWVQVTDQNGRRRLEARWVVPADADVVPVDAIPVGAAA